MKIEDTMSCANRIDTRQKPVAGAAIRDIINRKECSAAGARGDWGPMISSYNEVTRGPDARAKYLLRQENGGSTFRKGDSVE